MKDLKIITNKMLNCLKTEYGSLNKLRYRLPVVAVLYNLDTKVIEDVAWNDRSKDLSGYSGASSHAEQILCKKWSSKSFRAAIIVNIPPCAECMEYIHQHNKKNKMKIQSVFYIDTQQAQYKNSELKRKYGLDVSDLSFVNKHFNHLEQEGVKNDCDKIKKYYATYIRNLYLLTFIRINFIDWEQKYAYISKEDFKKVEKEMLSSLRLIEKKVFYKFDKCVRINVELLLNFYYEQDRVTIRDSKNNQKNNNGQIFLNIDVEKSLF